MIVGDIVTVEWERIDTLHNVEVVRIPKINGDVWIFKDKHGNEYFVKDFCKIIKDVHVPISKGE